MIRLSKRYAYDGSVKKSQVYSFENIEKVKEIHKKIINRTGEGAEMMGWMDYVTDKETSLILQQMLALYDDWQKQKINTVLVAGIGGSALGARAAIHMCINKYMAGGIKVIWMDSISPSSNSELLKHVKKQRIRPAAIIISKSGTTFETLLNYRLLKTVLIYKYGENNFKDKMVIVTGIEANNKLRKLANKMGYVVFDIPANIGGRFSALTPAGLLPMLMSGMDIFSVMEGAKQALKDCSNPEIPANTAYDYALHRYAYSLKHAYTTEILDTYEKKLGALLEQNKQMFAETEGKNGKGILPFAATYTKDLHSLGQFIQDGGPKQFFETTLWVRRSNGNVKVSEDKKSNDGYDYLTNIWLSEINRLVFRSVAEAHAKRAEMPVLLLEIEKMDPYNYGYFYMWMCISVTMSAYLMELNPFNQPGVEEYKLVLKEHLKNLKTSLENKKEINEERNSN